MKNLALKDMNVQELNENEMSTIEGGGLFDSRGAKIGDLVNRLEDFANTTLGDVGKLVRNVGKALL